jgi:hypothetical protein
VDSFRADAIRRWHAASAVMVGAPLYDGTQEDSIVAMACLQAPDATVLVVTNDPRIRRWDTVTALQLSPAVGPLPDGVTGRCGYHGRGRAMVMTTDGARVCCWDAMTGAEYVVSLWTQPRRALYSAPVFSSNRQFGDRRR